MIRILTDSATDFTQEELQKLNVRCVPMTIAFGGDTYTDGVDLPQEIFWQRMEAGQTPKATACCACWFPPRFPARCKAR